MIKVNEGRKIEFEDDVVIVKKNGKEIYKGIEDYEPMKDEPWKWDGKKYNLSGGYTKEVLESLDINESKSVKLTNGEIASIKAAVGSDARAGITDAEDLISTLDKASNGNIKFTTSNIEFLDYWNDLLKNYPNSPKVKYMDQDLKSALVKIFG